MFAESHLLPVKYRVSDQSMETAGEYRVMLFVIHAVLFIIIKHRTMLSFVLNLKECKSGGTFLRRVWRPLMASFLEKAVKNPWSYVCSISTQPTTPPFTWCYNSGVKWGELNASSVCCCSALTWRLNSENFHEHFPLTHTKKKLLSLILLSEKAEKTTTKMLF